MSDKRILVVGASGFIGSRIVALLLARGNDVICAGRDAASLRRRFPSGTAIEADLSRDTTHTWAARLAGIEAVVNAAGAFRGDLDSVHHRGPVALFEACARADIHCLVQISALGAGVQETRFLRTKASADQQLVRMRRDTGGRGWCVIRPSLVIGRGGDSTALFSALAALPRPLRLGPGTWQVQPIHVSDLARAVADLLEAEALPAFLDLVGPDAVSTDELTAYLRNWFGLPARPFLTIPLFVLRLAAAAGEWLPHSRLTRDSLDMLERGNTADAAPLHAVLGWRPRRLADALAAEPAVAGDLLLARLRPIRGLMRASLAAVWIGSGMASLLLQPSQATALLSGLGLSGTAAMVTTWAGASLDIVLGCAILFQRFRQQALIGQLVLMGLYSVLATISLPALWLDPFGPLLKNTAVLATILALLALEERR